MRRTLLGLTGLVALGGLALAFFALTPLALPGVQLAAKSCAFDPSLETTVVPSWSGASYRLAIEQVQNCAAGVEQAAVQRLGSDLFVRLKYRIPGGVSTGCNCRHRSELEIPALPRQDFRVHVYSWP